MKRTIDFILALTALVLLSPLLLCISVIICCDDRHSPLFTQRRLGHQRYTFTIYKFRTYHLGKVTRAGRWLRKCGIDELPQLINIIKGDMAIVGPRPLTPDDVDRLGWNHHYYEQRWNCIPGLTGLAQLHAGRSAKISFFYDRYYSQHQSIISDVKIISLSFLMNIMGKAPVRQWLRQRKHKSATNKQWQHWLTLFKQRANRPTPSTITSTHSGQTSDHQAYRSVAPSLARSLAIFQLGESGGGTIVKQVATSRLSGVDEDYHQAIALFVKEEHRHAEMLAHCVTLLGGKLIQTNWTEKLFVHSRRLMGVRLKVIVLLAAEVVGLCYYRLLASRLPPCEVRTLLNEIVADEQSHLQFHCEFLRGQANNTFKRMMFTLTWHSVTWCAMVVVYFDHQQALKDLQIPSSLLRRRWKSHVNLANEFVTSKHPNVNRMAEIDRQCL